MSKVELHSILAMCHDGACGDIFLANLLAKRLLKHDTSNLHCLGVHMNM